MILLIIIGKHGVVLLLSSYLAITDHSCNKLTLERSKNLAKEFIETKHLQKIDNLHLESALCWIN